MFGIATRHLGDSSDQRIDDRGRTFRRHTLIHDAIGFDSHQRPLAAEPHATYTANLDAVAQLFPGFDCAVLEAVRKLGLEGIVGKRLGSIYEPGERSGAWMKLRANMEQEFVVGGYIPGSRGFDALLVGVYQNRQLNFVAKVKNGFVPRIRDELFPALKALQTTQCPFKNLPEKRASRWGESLTAEQMDQCRLLKPMAAGLLPVGGDT